MEGESSSRFGSRAGRAGGPCCSSSSFFEPCCLSCASCTIIVAVLSVSLAEQGARTRGGKARLHCSSKKEYNSAMTLKGDDDKGRGRTLSA